MSVVGNLDPSLPPAGPALSGRVAPSDSLRPRGERVTDSYALSATQAGMLFHALREGTGHGVDIQQISMTLLEPLDLSLFTYAWQRVLDRHPVLRSRLNWEEADEPVQEVLDTVELPVTRADWRGEDAQTLRERLLELAAEDRLRGIDLRAAPLMRLFVARVGEEAFSVLWTFHHIVLDGRSFETVLREVFTVYDASRRRATAELPPARPYRDFIEIEGRQDLQAAEAFWREALKGWPGPAPLGVDHPAPRHWDWELHGPVQGARQARLSREASEELRDRAARSSVAVSTLLQAAWALLLHRCGGATDVVFGSTRSGRQALNDATGAAGVPVGLFIHTVPMRVTVSNTQSVEQWLADIRARQLAMRPYEQAPLARIQAWAPGERAGTMFESLVVYDHASLTARLQDLGGALGRRHFDYVGQTPYPLTLVAYGDEAMLLRLEYDRRRFDDAAIERMLGHLQTILGGLADDSLATVGDLPWLTPWELRQLTAPSRKAQSHAPGPTLQAWFELQVERAPHAPALTATDTHGQRVELSYAQLNERANRLAHRLRAWGVQPNQLVGVRTQRHAELVIALLAILKAGGAYLPLDPVYPADRVAFMLEDSAVQVVLTQASLRHTLVHAGVEAMCIDDAAAAQFDDAPNPAHVNVPGDLAYVIYTSGSTGKPKGVRISHQNVCRLFQATQDWFAFDERDVWTLFHSYAFDFSVWELWGALLYGGRLVVVTQELSRNIEAFHELLVQERVTVLNQTPTAFRRLVDLVAQQEAGPLSLRYVVFGGEALELQMLRPWFERFGDRRPRLVNMYGITETTVHVTYRPLTMADLQAGSGSVIGEPIPDLRIYLLDERLQPVPVGVAGELVVAGAGLSSGYLNRPELTDQRFVPDPFVVDRQARMYRSGDLARRLENGDLEYLGRIDQQVKIRGFRIELGEIESQVTSHPRVRQAAVVAREDVPGDKRLVAYVVSEDAGEALEAELREKLRGVLPDYMVPAHWVFVGELPLTPNGKLDVRALPAPASVARVAPGEDLESRTPVEQQLAEVWQGVLRLPQVGLHDHFFDLGGDSILSIQIIARCRQRGLAFTLKDLFEHPTIAQLAELIAQRQPQPVPSAPALGVPAGAQLLTPIQHWFFEQAFEDAHHWNQAFLFEVPTTLDLARLAAAWRELLRHQGTLRERFVRGPAGNWQVQRGDLQHEPGLVRIDLAQVDASTQARELAERCAEAQAGFDLSRGPLARALHFDLGADRPGRLLIAIHHLVVDGVSWRILLEELEQLIGMPQGAQPPRLPAPATMGDWSAALQRYAAGPQALEALTHWQRAVRQSVWSLPPQASGSASVSVEAVQRVQLDDARTRALLQAVPARFGTQINAALLSALMRALTRWTGRSELRVDLEGHGREMFDGAPDVSHTVGWFTSLFPLALELPEDADARRALLAVQTQLEHVPDRGLSFGVLRYLSPEAAVRESLRAPAAPILFNYLGQFDAVIAGSRLFRFAHESAGPWRSARAHRTHALEVVAMVREGCLEVAWHHDASQVAPEAVAAVAEEMLEALRELADLPALSQEPAPALADGREALLALPANMLDLDLSTTADVAPVVPPPPGPAEDREPYALTPMQRLFFAMDAARPDLGLEQWHFRLQGPVQPELLRQALLWVIGRHSILRSAFTALGAAEPLQAVVDLAELPWREEDWRGHAPADQEARFAERLREDAQQGFDLARPPLMRVLLVRVTEQTWHFLWTTHHLTLDGWSWPIVWSEVSQAYAALERQQTPSAAPALAYRDFVRWLREQAPDAQAFWRAQLHGFAKPTPLRRSAPPARETAMPQVAEHTVEVPETTAAGLQALARRLRLTPGTLFNAAWALLLAHGAQAERVVFGAAFSGRPPELPGIETLVGPCVNNVPLDFRIDTAMPADAWLQAVQQQLIEVTGHQYASPDQLQQWSGMPWRHRLFDSLVVFQNYQVDEDVRRLGTQVQSTLLSAPEATNYALTVTVRTGPSWRLRWLYDPALLGDADIRQLAAELLQLLAGMAGGPLRTVGDWMECLPAASRGAAAAAAVVPGVRGSAPVSPTSEREREIAALWCELFGVEQVSLDDNFFDLGGHSLLLLRAHRLLQERLQLSLPVVALLQHPTVRSLARHLEGPDEPMLEGAAGQALDRAHKQRQAMARQRRLWSRKANE